MQTILLSATIAALIAVPVAAQEAVEKTRSEPTKMVCKKFESTGTRLKNRRVCATEEQWRQREQEDQEMVNNMQVMKRFCQAGVCED